MTTKVANAPLNSYQVLADTVTVPNVGVCQKQLVQLDIGAAGSSDPITAANPLPVTASFAPPSSATATLSNVAGSATSVTILAANALRKTAILFNDSSAALYLKFGATASATDFSYKVFPNGTWEMPDVTYTGIIDGIWDSATGTARVTEL